MKTANAISMTFLLTFSFFTSAIADTLTKEAYKLEKNRISAEYKAGKDSCSNLSGDVKDVCMARVKGANDVSEAELEARMNPGAKTQYDLSIARAEANYSVAREQCNSKSGDSKDQCVRSAKDALESAKDSAKLQLGNETD